MHSDAWCLCLFLSRLAENDISPDMLAESLGKLTALHELHLDEGAAMITRLQGKLTALRKLVLRGTV